MDESLKGIVGIQNMGNTCYCNSIIQLLRMCPEWNTFCLTNSTVIRESNQQHILMEYKDIITSLWSNYKPAYVRPNKFISELKKVVKGTVYEMFGFPIPNDSHEFLIYLLDNFHEALKVNIEYNEIIPNTMCDKAQNGWNKFISKNNSEIVHIFFGMIRKTIYCTNCNNNTYQWEVFNSLKIPCEGDTFMEWIKNELKESDIEEYQCDNCYKLYKKRYPAKIYSHIWKLPRSLFITIRRFNPNGSKNMKICPYNGDNIRYSEFFAEESNDPSKHWTYEIKGICDHHGSHMGGHYNTQCKHVNEWWKIDDESTNKQSPQFSAANYILFFRYVLNV